MPPVSFFGTPVFYVFLIIVLWKFDSLVAFRILGVLITVEIACWTIKLFYKKDRPLAQPRENFIQSLDANSFPSIHSARISVLVLTMNLLYPDAFFFLLGILLIGGVGYSRIYLKKHYISDVIGGFLIGVVIAVIFHGAI